MYQCTVRYWSYWIWLTQYGSMVSKLISGPGLSKWIFHMNIIPIDQSHMHTFFLSACLLSRPFTLEISIDLDIGEFGFSPGNTVRGSWKLVHSLARDIIKGRTNLLEDETFLLSISMSKFSGHFTYKPSWTHYVVSVSEYLSVDIGK